MKIFIMVIEYRNLKIYKICKKKSESSPVAVIQKSYTKKAIIKNLFRAKKFNEVVNYHQDPLSIMNENFCKQLFFVQF